MSKDTNLIAKRLRDFIDSKNLTLGEFAKILELDYNQFYNSLSGKSDIQKIFILLHTKGNINLEWLITGVGEPEQSVKKLNERIEIFKSRLGNSFTKEIENITKDLYSKMPTFDPQNPLDAETYYKAQTEIEINKKLIYLKEEIPEIVEEVFEETFDKRMIAM